MNALLKKLVVMRQKAEFFGKARYRNRSLCLGHLRTLFSRKIIILQAACYIDRIILRHGMLGSFFTPTSQPSNLDTSTLCLMICRRHDISYYFKCMLCGAHACRSYLLVLQNVVGNAILLTTCARLIDESFRSTKYKGLGSPITSSQPLFKLRMRDLEGVWACFG